MECPKCHGELANNARYCGCGWKKANPFANQPVKIIDCDTDNCPRPAAFSININGLRVNTCEQCNTSRLNDSARKGLIKKGLDRKPDESQAQHTLRMRHWLKSNFPNLSALDIKADKPQREPGEDEDYKHP